MNIEKCKKEDFDQIIINIEEFWGSKRTLHLHHPILINEFGNTAFVIKDNNIVCAYLFGFYSQTKPIGYVHLIAVRNGYKKKGLATKLYNHFIELAKNNNCKQIKATTSPTNLESINFHKNIGMKLIGKDKIGEINVELNYSGPGGHRVIFIKDI